MGFSLKPPTKENPSRAFSWRPEDNSRGNEAPYRAKPKLKVSRRVRWKHPQGHILCSIGWVLLYSGWVLFFFSTSKGGKVWYLQAWPKLWFFFFFKGLSQWFTTPPVACFTCSNSVITHPMILAFVFSYSFCIKHFVTQIRWQPALCLFQQNRAISGRKVCDWWATVATQVAGAKADGWSVLTRKSYHWIRRQ